MRSTALFAWLWLLLACSAAAADAPEESASRLAAGAPVEPAQFASALRVEVISCVLEESAVDVSEMLRIARAELAPYMPTRREGQSSQPLLRVDACHDERLVLRLLSPEGPEQSVALHDVPPEHRPRVAALALAELVLTARPVGEWRAERASKTEKPAPAQAPAAQPAPAARADAARLPDWNTPGPPPAPPRSTRLGLGTEARLFLQQDLNVSYGPRLFVRLPSVDLTLLALFSRRSVDLGALRTGVVAMNVAAHLWRSKGAFEVAVSLGAELGVTWGRAEPSGNTAGSARSAQAQFASVFAQLSMGGALSDQAYAHAALAAGYALGVYAEVMDERAGTRGAFAGLSAGLAWLL